MFYKTYAINIIYFQFGGFVDRAYFVKDVRSVRVIYWLDAFAREVYVVRVEQI